MGREIARSRSRILISILMLVPVQATAQQRHRGNVFAAPTTVRASGWTAACYDLEASDVSCAVTRDEEGAPARVDITSALLKINFTRGCTNVGTWTTMSMSRKGQDLPTTLRFIERVLAPRASGCGPDEATSITTLIDLAAILLSATKPIR